MMLTHKVFGVLATAAVMIGGSVAAASAEPGPDGRYYGSLAAADLGDRWQISWGLNYPGWAEADNAALGQCDGGNCVVLARFADGCGSLAARGNQLLGGVGRSRGDAERAAMDAFGPPDLISISSGNALAAVVHTECTGNAG